MSDIINMDINNSKRKIGLNIINANGTIGMDVKATGGGGGSVVKQIYIGDTEPTDSNILIWIDTSSQTTVTKLITADGYDFITSENEIFILKEV